ncbi:protein delta homolog 1 [Engraulis encrasicolus]|uniref:protein delta homolog 1 n=1 Tax=Engraulis encrasicolus TaxID=184585 RepID=UPI002FD3967D
MAWPRGESLFFYGQYWRFVEHISPAKAELGEDNSDVEREGLECAAGCNEDNGVCEENGTCRCKAGWQGAVCEQCVPFPGCVHGTCEKPWQCVCEDGWIGSHCDQDTNPCSSKPCSGNSTCIETGEGGYLCVCPPGGYSGDRCHLRRGQCQDASTICQNGGTCQDAQDFALQPTCVCPAGFTGEFCELKISPCHPNPCANGGICAAEGDGTTSHTCSCPPGYGGASCQNATAPTAPLSPCPTSPCLNGGSCLNNTAAGAAGTAGAVPRCLCPPDFTGPQCAQAHHRSKPRPTGRLRPKHPDAQMVAAAHAAAAAAAHASHHGAASLQQQQQQQHYSLPAYAFHKLLRPPERELLKITLKETVHTSSGPLVTRSQLVCFAVLGLLTCLVVLGTTAIVFFGRCEAWMANAKYTQLVRQQRDQLLRTSGGDGGGGGSGGGGGGEAHSVNIILPEKIKLTNYGNHYTSI